MNNFLHALKSSGLTAQLAVLFLVSAVQGQIIISGFSLRYPLFLTAKGIEFERNLTEICGSLTKGDLPSAEWDCILKCHYKHHELYDDEYSHLWPRTHNSGMVTYYLRTYTNAMEPIIKIINKYYERCTREANERIADLRIYTFERLSDCRYYGYIYRSLEMVWMDGAKGWPLIKVKLDVFRQQKYIVHPVVIDAMIQDIRMLLSTSILEKKLFVPIKFSNLFAPQSQVGRFRTVYSSI